MLRRVTCALGERCLSGASWLSGAVARELLRELGAAELGEARAFKGALARLAQDVAVLRAEHERSSVGF